MRARRYTLILSAINIAKNQGFPQRLRFAVAGIAHALRHERSLRFQALALVAATKADETAAADGEDVAAVLRQALAVLRK